MRSTSLILHENTAVSKHGFRIVEESDPGCVGLVAMQGLAVVFMLKICRRINILWWIFAEVWVFCTFGLVRDVRVLKRLTS